MHRSRLSVLVILAAAAACSKNDAPEGTDILSQDRTLVARLEVDQETRQQPLPAACGNVALAAQPALASQQQARELTRQASDAEMQGDLKEARALLLRASELDGTNKSTAYQLGRTSEALGDGDAAIGAYCRYLALTPTPPEAVEAHQRLTKLSQSTTRVAAGSVVDSTSAAPRTQAPVVPARTTRVRQSSAPRVVASAPAASAPAARVPVRRPAPAPARERDSGPTSAAPSSAEVSPAPSAPAPASSGVDSGAVTTTVAGGDVVTTPSTDAANEPPSTAPRTARRGPSRAQSAGIGAAAGAIIGAAAGRSVKGAVMGAAAGGILGTMVGPTVMR